MELPDITKIPFLRGVGAFAFIGASMIPPFFIFYLTEPATFMSIDIIRLLIICLSFGLTFFLICLTFGYVINILFNVGDNATEKDVPLHGTALAIITYMIVIFMITLPKLFIVATFRVAIYKTIFVSTGLFSFLILVALGKRWAIYKLERTRKRTESGRKDH